MILLTLIFAGCGGAGKSNWQQVSGEGFSFQAPSGWRVSTRNGATSAASGSVDLVEAVSFRLVHLYRRSRFAAATRELDSVADGLAKQLHGVVRSRQSLRVNGLDAREYAIDYAGKTQEITFVLQGRSEYELVCRRAAGGDRAVCVRLLASFRLD